MEAFHQAKETTGVELGALLDAGDDAVVTLVAGETRLVAHRAVLMDRSPVFSAMFAHDTLEARSGQVTIADVEGPVLRQLLSYLYTLRAPQLPDMAHQLLEAADKYGVAGLKAACEQQVAAQLSVETAAAAAVLAVRHCCDSLRKDAINFIKDHTHQVMSSQGWAEAIQNQPKDVIEVSRLLANPPGENSAPAPADSGTSACDASQPHSEDRSRQSGAPASAAHATAASHRTPPPDDETVSRLMSLPAREKGKLLWEAARVGAVQEMEALLTAGANVAAADRQDKSALHYAVERGHVEAARVLVEWGAPVDARDFYQQTPLHLAAVRGPTGLVRMLLDASADSNASNSTGWTPLHYAAVNGNAVAAAALLEAGADKGARCDRGTPLDLARESNRRRVVDLLTRT